MSYQAIIPRSEPSAVPPNWPVLVGTNASVEDESCDSVLIANPYIRLTRIITKPDFYIFTTLLWVRTPIQDAGTAHRCGKLCQHSVCEAAVNNTSPLNHLHSDQGLLNFHRDRLADTAEALRWRHIRALERSEYGLHNLRSSIAMYLRCLPTLPPMQIERRKVKLMVNRLGSIRVDSTVIDCPPVADMGSTEISFIPKTLDLSSTSQTPIRINDEPMQVSTPCQVFLDTRPSSPSLFTTHKTSHRAHYARARARAKISDSAPTEKEVLLYNKHGEVMEASLCTVYFNRNGGWITPAAICGGNLGVTRRLALENGLCKQGTIEITEIVDGEMIWLSNGARGFFVGHVHRL